MSHEVDFAKQPSPVGRGTLGRRLMVQVAAVVALASIVLATATFLATRQILLTDTDRQLDSARFRQARTLSPDLHDENPRGIAMPGMPIGTIVLEVLDGRVTRAAILREGGADATISKASLQQLLATVSDGAKHSVALPGIGPYRVAAVERGQGTFSLIALPLATVNKTLADLLLLEGLLALAAILGAILITRSVVVRNLRPLHEVAATASRVSELQLDRGEVDLAIRVPEPEGTKDSEVGRVAAALNTMLANVEGALAARHASETKVRQFVADASHELRNPLAAIKGYAELTRRDRADLPEETQFALGRIESESARMSSLVEDMLLLARIDAGPALQLEEVDLKGLVVNALSDAQVAGPEHDWAADLPAEPITVQGDRFRLHQVVANLLANARTHTPPGTHVTAVLRDESGTAVLRVVDDGPGIAPELLGKVFERFVRADSARTRTAETSTGLGLAIVAAVVAAHGGRAGVTSEPGRTEFRIQLPLSAAPTP